MAKLADALDLGSSGRPWGFKSLHPHHVGSTPFFLVLLVAKLYLWATAHISPITHQCLWGPIFENRFFWHSDYVIIAKVSFTSVRFLFPTANKFSWGAFVATWSFGKLLAQLLPFWSLAPLPTSYPLGTCGSSILFNAVFYRFAGCKTSFMGNCPHWPHFK